MIAICPNPFRDIGLELTKKTAALLQKEGFQTVVCPVFSEEQPEVIPADINTCSILDVIDACTLVVVIGGDGTILSVARDIHDYEVPILGVNLGTKGFMASIEPEELHLIIAAAKNDNVQISCRMRLDIKLVRAGKVIYTDSALNDAVIHGYGDCIKLIASCEGDVITEFSGDGIIVATPTGSTGYSMSAGGPIVEPDAANFIISPICAHVMGARPSVIGPSKHIGIVTQKLHGRRAYLSVDGNWVQDLQNGDELQIKRSGQCTKMVDMGHKSFYEIAHEKLR